MTERVSQEAPGRFRKKPVEIEAIQFDGHNHATVSAFMGCECGFGNPVRDDCPYDHSKAGPKLIVIRTLEGPMRAIRGDWIIRGVKGEFYPCKPDIFEATYEPAAALPALEADLREQLEAEVREGLDPKIERLLTAVVQLLPVHGAWPDGFEPSERIDPTVAALPEEWAEAAEAFCDLHAEFCRTFGTTEEER